MQDPQTQTYWLDDGYQRRGTPANISPRGNLEEKLQLDAMERRTHMDDLRPDEHRATKSIKELMSGINKLANSINELQLLVNSRHSSGSQLQSSSTRRKLNPGLQLEHQRTAARKNPGAGLGTRMRTARFRGVLTTATALPASCEKREKRDSEQCEQRRVMCPGQLADGSGGSLNATLLAEHWYWEIGILAGYWIVGRTFATHGVARNDLCPGSRVRNWLACTPEYWCPMPLSMAGLRGREGKWIPDDGLAWDDGSGMGLPHPQVMLHLGASHGGETEELRSPTPSTNALEQLNPVKPRLGKSLERTLICRLAEEARPGGGTVYKADRDQKCQCKGHIARRLAISESWVSIEVTEANGRQRQREAGSADGATGGEIRQTSSAGRFGFGMDGTRQTDSKNREVRAQARNWNEEKRKARPGRFGVFGWGRTLWATLGGRLGAGGIRIHYIIGAGL
ncbi:hypothetical protein C8R43DRAFT_944298 [Mycena crocata]|nr:hypothetical protein C8R43DRAFT_944298 [Mycena crocata]